jgi:hypothetical protein
MNHRTIVTCKVYTELDFKGDSRVIGWWNDLERALEGLGNFGTECKWSYALFEEFYEGFHPFTKQKMWMKYDDEESEWRVYKPEETSFVRCINHAMG